MKHWKETAEILRRVLRIAEEGRRAALATVVSIVGSAYRRAGAKLLVEDDGATAGSISGGCLEADVRDVALDVLKTGTPRLVRYETAGDDGSVFGLGLGCSGTIEIFVRRVTDPHALEAALRSLELLDGDRAFAVSTRIRGESAGTVEVHAPGEPVPPSGSDLFVETLSPPISLLVFGAGDDAIPLAAYASDAGFRVTVVDHRRGVLSLARFPAARRLEERRPEDGIAGLPAGPRAFAVVKTHSFAHDREWVRRLLEAGVPYIGLLGPRTRGRRLLTQIGARPGSRVFTPAGLDLGAEGPEQIAIAIVAEMLAFRSSRSPAPLREKETAIHAD